VPRLGVRAESLRAGLKICEILSLFGKDGQEKIQVVTSLMTLKVHHVWNFRENPFTRAGE